MVGTVLTATAFADHTLNSNTTTSMQHIRNFTFTMICCMHQLVLQSFDKPNLQGQESKSAVQCFSFWKLYLPAILVVKVEVLIIALQRCSLSEALHKSPVCLSQTCHILDVALHVCTQAATHWDRSCTHTSN